MAYDIILSDGVTTLTTIPGNTIDIVSTSITLFGRGRLLWGGPMDTNLVHMLENFNSSTSPINQLQGQLWHDSANLELNFWDGSQWRPLASFDSDSNFIINNGDILFPIRGGTGYAFPETTPNITQIRNRRLDDMDGSGSPFEPMKGIVWKGNSDYFQLYVESRSPEQSELIIQSADNSGGPGGEGISIRHKLSPDAYSKTIARFFVHDDGANLPGVMAFTQSSGSLNNGTVVPSIPNDPFSNEISLLLNLGGGNVASVGPDIWGRDALGLAADVGIVNIIGAEAGTGGSAFDIRTSTSPNTATTSSSDLLFRLSADDPNAVGFAYVGPGGTATTPAFAIRVDGFDLILGQNDQVTRGNTGQSRALVKAPGSILSINHSFDFSGGTQIDSILLLDSTGGGDPHLRLLSGGVFRGLLAWDEGPDNVVLRRNTAAEAFDKELRITSTHFEFVGGKARSPSTVGGDVGTTLVTKDYADSLGAGSFVEVTGDSMTGQLNITSSGATADMPLILTGRAPGPGGSNPGVYQGGIFAMHTISTGTDDGGILLTVGDENNDEYAIKIENANASLSPGGLVAQRRVWGIKATTGDTQWLTGATVTLGQDPVNPLEAATKQYVDTAVGAAGLTFTPLNATVNVGATIGERIVSLNGAGVPLTAILVNVSVETDRSTGGGGAPEIQVRTRKDAGQLQTLVAWEESDGSTVSASGFVIEKVSQGGEIGGVPTIRLTTFTGSGNIDPVAFHVHGYWS